MSQSSPMSYEEWLSLIFDQPEGRPFWKIYDLSLDWDSITSRPEGFTKWGWDWESAIDPESALEYTARIFEDSAIDLAPFSDAQLGQGIYFLISHESEVMCLLEDEKIPWQVRRRCVRSFVPLYTRVFATRCKDLLGHKNETISYPLNSTCYIWWEAFPVSPRRSEGLLGRPLDMEILNVMVETLALPSVACQESALHGLGHMTIYYKAECRAAIDAYLVGNEDLPPKLRKYAEDARYDRIE